MRLKSIYFRENYSKDGANPWELQELQLGTNTLIVGKNATGKSRIINLIYNLALSIKSPKIISNSEWEAIFIDDNNIELKYLIKWKEGKITHEKIILNGVDKFDRTASSAKIYSEVTKKWQNISPPNEISVFHVRRDKNEFPFLESLVLWATGVRGFGFATTTPYTIEIPGNPFLLTSLSAVSSALENLSAQQLKKVLGQLESMGYILETAFTALIEELSPNFKMKMILLKEQGLAYPIRQFEISQGMFRAFALLTIFEFLGSNGNIGCILVDDLGEGLDYDRQKKLTDLIFNKLSESKIQFIATSNDSFLMNAIPLKDLTICYRDKHIVKCLNYSNSKEKFDKWQQLGLNNFDLFSTDYLISD